MGEQKHSGRKNMKFGKYAARNSSCWSGWFRQVYVGTHGGKVYSQIRENPQLVLDGQGRELSWRAVAFLCV